MLDLGSLSASFVSSSRWSWGTCWTTRGFSYFEISLIKEFCLFEGSWTMPKLNKCNLFIVLMLNVFTANHAGGGGAMIGRKAAPSPILFFYKYGKSFHMLVEKCLFVLCGSSQTPVPCWIIKSVSDKTALQKTFCFILKNFIWTHSCAYQLPASLDLLSTYLSGRCWWFPYWKKMFYNSFLVNGWYIMSTV